MARAGRVIVSGSILSNPLRAVGVRFAWAIKPTIRWPLSYHERAEVSASRLNAKNVERKVAVNGASEFGIIKLGGGLRVRLLRLDFLACAHLSVTNASAS